MNDIIPILFRQFQGFSDRSRQISGQFRRMTDILTLSDCRCPIDVDAVAFLKTRQVFKVHCNDVDLVAPGKEMFTQFVCHR